MADGKLGMGETRRVAAHLRDCESCRALLSDFERTKSMMRSMEAPAMPEEKFWQDTFRMMRTADLDRESERQADMRRARRQLQGAFAVSICLLGAIIIGPMATHVGPTSTPTTAGASMTDDAIDNADVSTFVRAHTEAAAYQPLGDPDRQQMIAAEAEGSPAGDQATEAVASADVSP